MPEAVLPRWFWQNFVQLGGTLITVSSEQLNHPKVWLRDQMSSKRWRSKDGWTIIAGFNDKFDFQEGATARVATLTPGTYETGDLMSAELQTQMNVVAATDTYVVTYDSGTNKFTVARDTGSSSLSLLHDSGSNAATSCSLDLGFDIASDDTGFTTYEADNVAYQSRQYIWFDLGAAFGVRAGIIFDSNLESATDTVTMQADTSVDPVAPTFSQVLSSGNDLFAAQFTEQSFQFWGFLIDSVQNSAGFVQIGVPFIGSYSQPSIGYGNRYVEGRQELSNVQTGDQGAHFQNLRPTRGRWNIQWNGMTDADKNSLESIIDFVKVGRSFFFGLDVRNDQTNIVYATFLTAIPLRSVPVEQWAVQLQLNEALGG